MVNGDNVFTVQAISLIAFETSQDKDTLNDKKKNHHYENPFLYTLRYLQTDYFI